jgi:hypothetical protein
MPAYGTSRNWKWVVLQGLFVVGLAVVSVVGLYLARLATGAASFLRPTLFDAILIWLVGTGILALGVLEIGLGLRLKSWHDRWTRPLGPPAWQPARASAWRTDRRLSTRRSH